MNLLQMSCWCVVAMIFIAGWYNWLTTGTPTVLIVILGTVLTIAIVGAVAWLIIHLLSMNESIPFPWTKERSVIGKDDPQTNPDSDPYGVQILDEYGKVQLITYDDIYGSIDHHHPSRQREALEHGLRTNHNVKKIQKNDS